MTTKRAKPPTPWVDVDDVRFLLDEICVETPDDRHAAIRFDDERARRLKLLWPDGWWAVSDYKDGYIAFFENEADASAFKFMLVNAIKNGATISQRYRRKT